jgi:hypothetical protein
MQIVLIRNTKINPPFNVIGLGLRSWQLRAGIVVLRRSKMSFQLHHDTSGL